MEELIYKDTTVEIVKLHGKYVVDTFSDGKLSDESVPLEAGEVAVYLERNSIHVENLTELLNS